MEGSKIRPGMGLAMFIEDYFISPTCWVCGQLLCFVELLFLTVIPSRFNDGWLTEIARVGLLGHIFSIMNSLFCGGGPIPSLAMESIWP